MRTVLMMTREHMVESLHGVTVAPITTRVRGLPTEVAVGPPNGLQRPGVVNCDNLRTVARGDLGPVIGSLLPEQEPALAAAISAAFELYE